GIPRDYALAYAVELFLVNQYPPAKQIVDSLINSSSNDYEALALRLMIERATDQKDALPKTMARLESIMFNRIQSFRQALRDKAATTRPVDAATPIDWG